MLKSNLKVRAKHQKYDQFLKNAVLNFTRELLHKLFIVLVWNSFVVHKFYPQNPLYCDPWRMSLWALSLCYFFYLPPSPMNTLSATWTWGSPFFVFPRTTLRHNLQPRELLIRSVPYRSFTSFGHEKLLSILWFSGSIHRILFPIETLSFIPSQSCVNSFVRVHMRFLLPVELSLSTLSSGSALLHWGWFLHEEIRQLHHIDHRPLFDFSEREPNRICDLY